MGSSSKDDDSGSEAEASSGDKTPSNSSLFSEGERVLAYHGPRIYEAKVQKAELRKKEWRYFVHYLGWNKKPVSLEDWFMLSLKGFLELLCSVLRKFSFINKYTLFQKGTQKSLLWVGHIANSWDEWVGMDRLMKHTPDNVLKQQTLEKKQGVDKSLKPGRSSQIKPKNSTDSKMDKDDPKINVAKGKKRKSDSGIEKDNLPVEKLVKIQIPSTLKKQLVDDWEFVTQQDKLVKLPRSPNVDDILTKYLEYMSKKDGMITDSIGEILKGIRCYFDKALPVMLLYKKERQQYHDTVKIEVSPSTIYGAEHLLRLFVKLPELLAYVNIEDDTSTRLQQKLLDFLKFLQKNQSVFFLSAYDGSKVSEGKGKGKD